jgi:putative transposase
MDDTKLDLFVIDSDRGMPIGRPTIFTLIDVCTKMPTGLNVSFHAPSYLSVMQCLMHSIKKKDHIKERYPEIENEWRCYGVPDLIVVDNAKQYYSESFEDAAVQLNFIIDYAPVRVPWYKASIERYFGTLNRQLLHHQPGTSFSNIFDKGDYDPKKNAVISFETFLKIIHVFIIDIYSREEHDYDGFPDVPSRRWDEWIKEFPPSLPSTVADLKVLIGQIEWRVISPNGVELFGLFYNSEELAPLRSRLKGTKAKIKLDPNDLSVVYVADIERGRYIPVPAKNQHYTEGLTLFQHDVIRRHARQMVKDYVNIEALCRAKELIKKIVRREWEESKKTDTRVRMARFLNYGWQAHDGGIEAQADGNEGNNNRIEQQNELPRLHCDASSGKAESDIGSAFPISEVLNEGDGEYGNAQISGAIEVKQEANNGRSQTKPSKSTAEKSKRVSKQNELRNDGESNFVNSSISYNKDVPHDETKWGSEYE